MQKILSIIVVHYAMNEDRSQWMRASIDSLVKTTRDYPCEIIVADNGGNDEDSKWLLGELMNGNITHYLRNKDNLHFSYGRNQAIKLAEGEYICIADNDIKYNDGWLEACLKALEQYPEKKLIASPISYPVTKKFVMGTLDVGGKNYTLDMRAGSNCFIMRRSTLEEIGLFHIHIIAGTKFADALVRHGYLVAVTPENMVEDMGFRKGYNFKGEFKCEKILTNGEKLNFVR